VAAGALALGALEKGLPYAYEALTPASGAQARPQEAIITIDFPGITAHNEALIANPQADARVIIDPDTILAVLYSWMFRPLGLRNFVEAVENFFENKSSQSDVNNALASLFIPFLNLPIVVSSSARWPYWRPRDAGSAPLPANVQLLRHWAAKSADHALKHLRQYGFPAEAHANVQTRAQLQDVAAALDDVGSPYGFVVIARRVLIDIQSVAAVQDADLEVLLLDALRERYLDAQSAPDLVREFDMAKHALLSFRLWGAAEPPSAADFQARPCSLLRVRALDLSSVPELQDVARGVRVFFPHQIPPGADVLALGDDLLKPYLANALRNKSATVFRDIWREAVAIYQAHAEARRQFVLKCENVEAVVDVTFE
jgi:hypothetical protein